jgi:hypothetical protein
MKRDAIQILATVFAKELQANVASYFNIQDQDHFAYHKIM